METPYLIQRAKIDRPLNGAVGLPLSKAVRFDYMGSAEFEFGAIPAAFREVRDNYPSYRADTVPSIMEGESMLRVFHGLSAADFPLYVRFLEALRDSEHSIQTKEAVGLDPKSFANTRTDFWWDINNNVMFSFDKYFMRRLPAHLETSFKLIQK